MCLFVCISVSFHGIFLKIHMSNFTCMHYKQYLGVHWRDFPENSYVKFYMHALQTVPWRPLEGFSWKFICQILHACALNGTLASIGGIFLKIHMSNSTCMHYKRYLGVHWRDFPENLYVKFYMHALQTVPWRPLEGFSWKFICQILHACTTNGTLASIGGIFLKIHVKFYMHALQTVPWRPLERFSWKFICQILHACTTNGTLASIGGIFPKLDTPQLFTHAL